MGDRFPSNLDDLPVEDLGRFLHWARHTFGQRFVFDASDPKLALGGWIIYSKGAMRWGPTREDVEWLYSYWRRGSKPKGKHVRLRAGTRYWGEWNRDYTTWEALDEAMRDGMSAEESL